MLANIRILREKQNISQQKLADAVGLSQQSIYQYENGIAEPDIDTLIKIATYFNVSVDYIVGNTEIKRLITEQEEEFLSALEKTTSGVKESIWMLLDEFNKIKTGQ